MNPPPVGIDTSRGERSPHTSTGEISPGADPRLPITAHDTIATPEPVRTAETAELADSTMTALSGSPLAAAELPSPGFSESQPAPQLNFYEPVLAPRDTTPTGAPLIPPPGALRPPGMPAGAPDTSAAQRGGNPDTTRRDTTKKDTTLGKLGGTGRYLFADTTFVVDYDSSARMAQWKYVRHDRPYVQMFPERTYPLYLSPRITGFRREVMFDSSGTSVTFRETYGGVTTKVPVSIGLAEYIRLREKYEVRRMFAEDARKSKALVAKNDLAELLSNITQINIPIPANPIFSIFGKNEIKLNISGAVDIKAGFRNIKSDQTTLSVLDQSRNEPDFAQEVQVNVNGTIGDKLNILADWNTKRTFEYENQLKIKYTGYEDEIVQSVEAGNVSLSTPASFIGSSQALFGIKAKFQMGPLTLTTLASQKKGQIKTVSVSGGSSEQTFEFRPYEYATTHYWVDPSYITSYEDYYQNDPPKIDNPQDQIVEAEVWVQRQGTIPDPTERQGIAILGLGARPDQTLGGYPSSLRSQTPVPGQVETARFVRLDPSMYELEGNGYTGVIAFNTSIGDQQIIGITYRTAGTNGGNGPQYGEFVRNLTANDTTTIILKMVKPQNLLSNGPSYKIPWSMLLKNVYPIPGVGRNLKQSGFSFDIYRRIPGASDQNSIPAGSLTNEPLLRVLGLDRYNADGTPAQNGDGVFDFRPGRTISQTRAEITFPYRRPFDEGIQAYFASKGVTVPDTSSLLFSAVYDTTQTFAQQNLNNRYVMRGKATGDASSRFSLGFNVVENSVQVILNGNTLTPNVDYTVDYIIGEVVIKNAAALVPGANLQIKYEQNDLFQLASKTLLGARGDLAITPTTNLGFTIMNLNQQTLSDKARLGEEPTNNTILGVDGSTSFELPFLTKALDALPLFQTKEMSSLKVSGEAAYMIPDPNTLKSTVASDNSQGVAYVDDFEGARRTYPIGMTYYSWTQASPPEDSVSFPVVGGLRVPDTTRMFSKGKMIWFNRLPSRTALTDIWPRKLPGSGANNIATILDFEYFPLTRGQFNYSPDLHTTLTPKQNWGGVMKTLSVSALNLSKENINFIEIWMQIARAPADSSAKMIIDLGAISERVIPGGINAPTQNSTTPNSEDLINRTNPTGVIQSDRDLGLDMLGDADERLRYAGILAGQEPSFQADPSGDDYYFDNSTVYTAAEDFTHINGTEGNLNGPGGRIPDTEDLNSNGQCDLANSYYEYELSLDTLGNKRIVGGGNLGWYQFRIPVGEFARTIGSPTFENIEYIRVFFRNATDTIAVRIADFNLVGNQWQKLTSTQGDSSYNVTVVSLEDNPTYQSPPGVIRERDKTNLQQNIYANEQSLDLVLNRLPDGESRQAVKFYTYKALNLINYRVMKMFVHCDPTFNYTDASNYDAQVFFRFGLDTLNFYEYRAPLRRDPANGDWTEVVINFGDLTAIKQSWGRPDSISPPHPVPGGPPGAVYRVLGNPSLTQIVFLGLGVENPAGVGTIQPLRGEVWFDELRLVSVDDSKGWAYRFDSQLKLADLGAVAFNYSRVDPHFHALEDRFGSLQTTTNWGLTASMSLDRFFPESWAGTSLPISFSHSESFVSPLYLPNSDILVSAAAEQAGSADEANALIYNSQTRRVSNSYAAPTFKLNLPSQAWYINDTFNKLTFGFTYTTSKERNPAVIYSNAWSWNARVSYAINFPADSYIMPFKSLFDGIWLLDEYKNLKIYYIPSNFSWSVGSVRSRSNSLQRVDNAQEIISRNFAASRQLAFSWKATEGGMLNLSGDYGVSVESSLLNLELDQYGQQRPFSKILGDIFFSDRLVNFGQDTRYSQRNNFNTRPTIPNIFNIRKYLDLTFGYSVDYAWQNTLTHGDLGKSVGFNNSITLSANFKMKQLFDPLFEDVATMSFTAPRGRRGTESGDIQRPDSSARPDTSAPAGPTGTKKTIAQLKQLLKVLIKIPILDYDNINISFSQTNGAQNSGVIGGPGFVNFWGRIPFLQDALPENGPSRLYQLGLISDPTGKLTNFSFRPKLPFFGWDVSPGVRADSGVLVNTYRETNRLSFKTSRALWEGARVDLNWNVGWSYSRTQNLNTDGMGIPTITNTTTTGSVDRSFLTFPDVFVFGIFKTSLKEVSKAYAEAKANSADSTSDADKLNKAFQQGFEAFPILSKLFGQYYPRVNWTLRWDGLEKLPLFAGFVSRLSLDHSYNSNYTRQYENLPGGGGERTDGQSVKYGFAPLVGLNFTFKEFLKGSFGANLRYNTNTSYDLVTSSQNIVESSTNEFSFTASYSRRGFEIPFFGLSLSNDVDLSMSYSVSSNSRKTYDISTLDFDVTGTPLEGSTRTVMEPRIKYVLSARVNASVYYRYTKIEPDANGSRIPGSTTNEAGLDVHIAIQ